MRHALRELAAKFGTGEQLDIAEYPKSKEQIEAMEEYGRRIAQDATQSNKILKPIQSTTIDYLTACEALKSLRAERQRVKRATQDPNFTWAFTDTDKTVIANLIKYFINDPSCAFPLHKGLWIWSAPGVGKTEILTLLSSFTNKFDLPKKFDLVNMSKEYDRAKNDKNCDNLDFLVQKNKCLDEFGHRFGDVNSYGNKINLNEAVIEQRYIRNQKFGQQTHLVSNKSPEEVEEIMSAHIADRLMGMCTVVEWKGGSKR